jgi:hypothetical protein
MYAGFLSYARVSTAHTAHVPRERERYTRVDTRSTSGAQLIGSGHTHARAPVSADRQNGVYLLRAPTSDKEGTLEEFETLRAAAVYELFVPSRGRVVIIVAASYREAHAMAAKLLDFERHPENVHGLHRITSATAAEINWRTEKVYTRAIKNSAMWRIPLLQQSADALDEERDIHRKFSDRVRTPRTS